mgnify:CR=1 FL=1
MIIMTYPVKIIIGGSGATGKTTLCARLNGQKDLFETHMTPGIEIHALECQENTKGCIWDLGGQERFRFVQDAYIRGTKILILMYSVEWIHSARDLASWVSLIPENDPPKKIFLVANKIDSPRQVVQKSDIVPYIQKYEMEYYELSAKTGQGVPVFKAKLEETVKQIAEEMVPPHRRKQKVVDYLSNCC